MSALRILRASSLPATPALREKNCMYLVKQPGKTTFDMYVVDAAGNAFSGFTSERLTEVIAEYSNTTRETESVANIAARNALVNPGNRLIFVDDATGDPTVEYGSAMYFYKASTASYVKVWAADGSAGGGSGGSGGNVQWSDIIGAPNVSVAGLEQAVANSHTHANKDVLDKLSVVGGELHYNGAKVASVSMGATNW